MNFSQSCIKRKVWASSKTPRECFRGANISSTIQSKFMHAQKMKLLCMHKKWSFYACTKNKVFSKLWHFSSNSEEVKVLRLSNTMEFCACTKKRFLARTARVSEFAQKLRFSCMRKILLYSAKSLSFSDTFFEPSWSFKAHSNLHFLCIIMKNSILIFK